MAQYVPQYVRSRVYSNNSISIPHSTVIKNGIVAIVDISGTRHAHNLMIIKTFHAQGYSKLTTHLGEVFGEAGGAKVRELLNPPFERIIDAIHNRNGSIIKFAGDAGIELKLQRVKTEKPKTFNLILIDHSHCSMV